MFRIAISTMLALVFVTAVSAQIPTKGNIFLGYSYVSVDTNSGNRAGLNGWNGSLEGKIFPFVGIVADISGVYGSRNFPVSCGGVGGACLISANAGLHNVLFGPRVSIPIGSFSPFAEALFGASHIHGTASGFSDSDTAFGEAIGGGIDYRIVRGLGLRVEGDFLQTRFFSDTQNNFKFSTGLVVHF